MKRFFSIRLLLASMLLLSSVAHLRAGALDDLNAIEIIAQAQGKQTDCLHELRSMLIAGEQPDAALVEAAFGEAAVCLAACKETLAEDDFEQMLLRLDESYDELTCAELPVKGTKHFYNLVVYEFLSAGTLTVGGNATIGNNLTVDNNAVFLGNVTFSGGETINGPINLNTNGTASTNIGDCVNATDIRGTVAINTDCATPTTIATGGGSLTLGNATGNIFFPTNLAVNTPGNYFLAIDSTSGELKLDSGSVVPGVILNGGQLGPITIGTTNATGIAFVTDGANNPRLTIDTNGGVTIQNPAGGETALTIAGGGETISSGNLAISAGDIILPVANSAGTQGLLELGGASSASNVALYEYGTRNLFGGHYTTPNTAVTGADNISFGTNANSLLLTASNTIALGSAKNALAGAQATALGAVALGGSDGTYAGASATATDAIAIGVGSSALGVNSVAVGPNASASAANATSVGYFSTAATSCVAVGFSAEALGNSSIAIGENIIATSGSIVVGNATANTSCTIAGINGVTVAGGSPVFISSSGQLGTVGGPVSIINGGQQGPITIGTTNAATGIAFVTGGANNPRLTIDTNGGVTIQNPAGGETALTIAGGGETISSGSLVISAGDIILPVANSAGTQGLLELGGASSATNVALYEYGARNLFGGNYTIINATITGTDNLSFGTNANGTLTNENSTIAIGTNSSTGASYASAIGYLASAFGQSSLALGTNASATGLGAIAIGNGVTAGANQTAISNIYSSSTPISTSAVYVNSAGVLGTMASSRTYKENFRPLDAYSAQLYNLNPVLFDYREEFGGEKNQIGLIAEEVEQHLPELVVYDDSGDIRTVKYHLLPTLLLNELQQHQKDLAELRAEVAMLRVAMNKLS